MEHFTITLRNTETGEIATSNYAFKNYSHLEAWDRAYEQARIALSMKTSHKLYSDNASFWVIESIKNG